jgi:hypothetical protein
MIDIVGFCLLKKAKKIKEIQKIVSLSPTGGNPDFSSGRKDGGNMDGKNAESRDPKKF